MLRGVQWCKQGKIQVWDKQKDRGLIALTVLFTSLAFYSFNFVYRKMDCPGVRSKFNYLHDTIYVLNRFFGFLSRDISSCSENLSDTATTCGISGWLQSQQSTFTSSIRSLDAFWWASFIMYTEILRNVHRNIYRFFSKKTFGFSLRACCSVTLWQHLTRRHWTLQKMFLTAKTRFIFVEVKFNIDEFAKMVTLF